MVKNNVYLCMVVALFVACEKEVELDIPVYDRQIVVEGRIEAGQPAEVVLTYSIPFFGEIDSSNLLDYRLTTAKVIVSDDEDTEILTLRRKKKQYPPYVYESSVLKGKVGKTFALTVVSGGDSVTADAFIPEPIMPDSVWYALDSETDTTFTLWLRFTDPPAPGHYYRTRTKVLGEEQVFSATRTSVYSDAFFNGKQLKMSLGRGVGNVLETGHTKRFVCGTDVVLEFSVINKEVFDFWNAYQNLMLSSGNPFSSPNNALKSNVNGAIGIWGGYGVSFDTVFTENK